MNTAIGFIGLGIMGASMVRNLIDNGHEVSVWNRSEEKAASLVAHGAKWACSPAQLSSRVSVLCTCVSNDKALEDILFGPTGAIHPDLSIRTIIDFSTISPGKVLEFSQRLETKGVSLIDAPVSGGDVGAQKGTLTVMLGGDAERIREVSSIFKAVGNTIVHAGPVGSGQLTKCVNQLVVAGTVAAMTEGLRFAEVFGLNLSTTLDIISSGAAGSWSLDNYAPRILANDLGPGFFAKDMLKDLRIVLEQSAKHSLHLPAASLIESLYAQLCESCGQELGNHALIELYRRKDHIT